MLCETSPCFVCLKLLVLNFLCTVLHQTFFQCKKNLFSYLGRKRRIKWWVEELRRRAANTNWSFLNALMIESLKGFSRFSKEAMEEGSKQNLTPSRKAFWNLLMGMKMMRKKNVLLPSILMSRKPRNLQLFCTAFILSIHLG